ncbi:MAG TPA: efflux RND transporter periplasmic adaptor subunit [Candidatus Angelobacter sp.]|nr:efflux RND transporter periplasmic adaptor subunit [Candidatus Angelobacter sp.]
MKNATKIFVALAGMAALSGCSASRQVTASTPESISGVRTLQVQPAAIADVLQATGTVRSWRTAPLAAQVMANVVAVNVREGDSVRRGQTLLVMDGSQFRASADRAQAAVQAGDHEIASAQADLELAQAEFKRIDYLYQKDIISAREHDQAKARLDSGNARLALAQANREEAASTLQQSKVLLGYTAVPAPFDGVVTERRIDPGALATPGMPLLTIEEAGHYRLEVTVDERDLKFVRQGESVPVVFDAFDGGPLSTKVVQIVPAADPASRSFVVKLDLPSHQALRSGLFGRANFSRGEKQAITLPRSAVIDRGQLQNIYIVGDRNLATLRYVTLGPGTGDRVEVLSGLTAGETVIVDPAGRDLAGKRIEVK